MKWIHCLSALWLSLCFYGISFAQVHHSGVMPSLSAKGDLRVAADISLTGSHHFSPAETAAYISSQEMRWAGMYSPLRGIGVMGSFSYNRLYAGRTTILSKGKVLSGEVAAGTYRRWEMRQGRYLLTEAYLGFGGGKSKVGQWDGSRVEYDWLRSSFQPSARVGFGNKLRVGTALRIDMRHSLRMAMYNEPMGFETWDALPRSEWSFTHIMRVDAYWKTLAAYLGITPNYANADIGFFLGCEWDLGSFLARKTE